MKFRKKPVVIDAVQYQGKNMQEIIDFVGKDNLVAVEIVGCLGIATLEGVMKASIGDWIIKGVNNEFYPCKPDIFVKTYEVVA
jgi:hypothetical protein